MFTTNNITISHHGGDPIIQSFSLHIPADTMYTILGPNGVGKSSLLRYIWQAQFGDRLSLSLPIKTAYLPQDMPGLDFAIKDNLSIYDILYSYENLSYERQEYTPEYAEQVLAWYCEVAGETPSTFKSDLQNKLHEIGFHTRDMAKNFTELSPGSQKKLLIATLFASQPDFIIGDELSNHLDAVAITVLSKWIKESKAAILVVDHSQDLISQVTRNFVVLEQTKSKKPRVYTGLSLAEVFADLEERRELQRQEQVRAETRQAKIEADLRLQRNRVEVYNAPMGKVVQHLKKKLVREVTAREALEIADQREDISFKTFTKQSKVKASLIATIKNLKYKTGENSYQIISEADFYKGVRYRISGPNGSGKSSLLRLMRSEFNSNINNNTQYVSGDITFGKTVNIHNFYYMNQRSKYEQNLTVQDFVEQSMAIDVYQTKSMLRSINLEIDPECSISSLSLSQTMRLELAIIARHLHDIEVLILDEPGNYLDIYTQESLVMLLKQYKGGLIFVSHDQTLASKIGYDEEISLNASKKYSQ